MTTSAIGTFALLQINTDYSPLSTGYQSQTLHRDNNSHWVGALGYPNLEVNSSRSTLALLQRTWLRVRACCVESPQPNPL